MKLARKAGIILIIFSTLCWAAIPAMPFIPVSAALKLTFGSVLVIMGEIFFWLGAAILGKDIAKKYIGFLNPLRWIKKKRNN